MHVNNSGSKEKKKEQIDRLKYEEKKEEEGHIKEEK